MKLSDDDLLREWENARKDITTGEEFSHRGWYHELYRDAFRGKKLLDVGSGFGVDSITWALNGANVTFLDIPATNLEVIKRLCRLHGIRGASFVHLSDFSVLKELPSDFDVIYAQGSLHHAPMEVVRPEIEELARHLKTGGRWIQLAYPKSRWMRDGSPAFGRWGAMTDGEGTPWSEWYDAQKLLGILGPDRFDVVLNLEFHDQAFVWFDFVKRKR